MTDFVLNTSAIRFESLKVNETAEPVGLSALPIFSWIPSADGYGGAQIAYRVIVASSAEKAREGIGNLWDSGRVESPRFCSIPYEGRALASHTAYYWRVTVWGTAGAVGTSEIARFTTGILSPAEWKGKWICCPPSDDPSLDRASMLLRRSFMLRDGISEAYLSIAGLGLFEVRINGELPDNTLLNCCNTQYNRTVLYRTFDVAHLLSCGANAIGVELGNGFYNEQSGVWNWQNAEWRDLPKLLLQMTVRYADGTAETLCSDLQWKATADGPTRFNSIYYGETYDARREQVDWASFGYDASGWSAVQTAETPSGKLVCQIEDPVRRMECGRVCRIERLADGSLVLTAPEMIAGWAKITLHNLAAGDTVTVRYGEKRNADGSVQRLGGEGGVNAHWWTERAIMTDTYIAKGEERETFEPKFSYKGFQFIQIFGYTGEFDTDDVILYRVCNAVEETGRLETSDPLINDLHAMMVRTMRNNLQGKPTDTPVWEKNGWLGDLNVALETFAYNFDLSNFLPNFVEIMDDCFEEYGVLPQMVPTADWGVADHYVWNSVFVFAVYALYQNYGMLTYMQSKYTVLKEYATKIISAMEKKGWIASDGQLGDWVSPMNCESAQYNESPNEGSGIVATAYVYKMLQTMERIAELCGQTDDIPLYQRAIEQIFAAFNAKFYCDEGYYETNEWHPHGPQRTKFRQTSQLVPLAFGMVPKDRLPRVVDRLIADIRTKGEHLDTGCVGTREILPVLSDCGYVELAYRILTNSTYPSWGFMLRKGATSLWEMWEPSARSLDHYFLGTYDEWLYRYLAGITDVQNGYETFTVNPFIPKELLYVTCTEKTVRGMLEASWEKREDGSIEMKITIPFGSTATVIFPTDEPSKVTSEGMALSEQIDGVCAVGCDGTHAYAVLTSGSHVFRSANDVDFARRML